MAKRIYGKEYGFQARAVHTGNDVDAETGAIKRPITMAKFFRFSVGIEDLRDIIADLKQAFEKTGLL